MRTSEEIYHRIRWDARFDPARFVIGVNVHAAEPKRMPLPAFTPGGDMPWHRVVYIEADGVRVWDRLTGADLIDSTRAGYVRAPQKLRPPFFEPRTAFAWSEGGWAPARPQPPTWTADASDRLRVLTWNSLWDKYDADRLQTHRRRPLLLERLRAADADLIALQEVEPPLARMLMEAPWVRDGYTLSSEPDGPDIDECGVLILSRRPVLEAAWHAFGPYKAAAAVTLALESGPLVVVSVHLTSDHSKDGATRRRSELAELAGGLATIDGQLIVLGDFNDGSGLPAEALGLRDAWIEAGQPEAPTFDPRTNPLAAISSLSGRAARLDRVLVRGAAARVTAASLEGSTPATDDGLFVSDHCGVLAELGFGEPSGGALDVAPTARTALAWIPPAELWPPIQALREKHDPQFGRWPPHVNLLFGFVPESSFEAAAQLLASAAQAIEPFHATLEGVRSFRHRQESTVWLDPAAAGVEAWTALRQALARGFPRCSAREEGYTPHLTLGKSAEPEPLERRWTAQLGRVEARVGELTLLSRRAEEPMRARATLELGTGRVRWLEPDVVKTKAAVKVGFAHTHQRAGGPLDSLGMGGGEVSKILERLRGVLPGAVLHVVGSRRLGCSLPGGDLDLVAALPGSLDLDALEARLRTELPGCGARRVLAVRVPGMELRAGGLDIDLALVRLPEAIQPADAVARRMELDEAAAMSLGAVSDADALLASVGERRAPFLELARSVKGWARAKGLDAAPFGGLPGLAWLVLAARCVREADEIEPDELLARFFGAWAAWDWRRPIHLLPEPPAAELPEAPVRISTPTAPVRSCSDQVGAAGLEVLVEELYSAWEAAAEGQQARLLAPPELHRRHAAWASIELEAPDADALAASAGWVRGRVRALISALERAGVRELRAWPRPWRMDARHASWAIGLGRNPPSAEALARITAGWSEELRGVEVRWLEGGDIPTLR